MSIWNKFKTSVERYVDRKLKEQAELKQTELRDFGKEFSDEFDEMMRERSERNSMKIVFHQRAEEEDPQAAQSLREKMGVGTVEGYELPDLWKAQRTLDPDFKVIDFSAAKERLEQEDWKPTQITRICDGVMSRITHETDVDEDGDEVAYYAWEVSSLSLNITVSGTCFSLNKAKRNCDLSVKHVGAATKAEREG